MLAVRTYGRDGNAGIAHLSTYGRDGNAGVVPMVAMKFSLTGKLFRPDRGTAKEPFSLTGKLLKPEIKGRERGP